MHGDGGRGVHVRVSCWLSAADGASEPCDIGAVGASASCVWCDERADGCADRCTDGCADGIADSSTDRGTDGSSDRHTNGCAHRYTDRRAYRSTHCRTDGSTDRITDYSSLRRWHALLLDRRRQ